jgi:hypothetical protein
MEPEPIDQQLHDGSDVASCAPLSSLQRKPVPTQHNVNFPYFLVDGNSNDHDSASEVKPQFEDVIVTPVSSARRRLFIPWRTPWLFEVLGAILAVCSMLALLGTLLAYQNRVAQNLSNGITLNGLVAVLSTICRTALLIPVASGISQGKWLWFSSDRAHQKGQNIGDLETFDKASRGAWGSFQLLWRLRAR